MALMVATSENDRDRYDSLAWWKIDAFYSPLTEKVCQLMGKTPLQERVSDLYVLENERIKKLITVRIWG